MRHSILTLLVLAFVAAWTGTAQEEPERSLALPAQPAPKVIQGKATKKKPEFPPFNQVMAGFVGPYKGFYDLYENKKKNRLYAVVPSRQINKEFLLGTSFAGGTPLTGWMWNDYLFYWQVMGKRLVLLQKEVHYRPSGQVAEVVKKTYTDRVFLSVPILTKGGGGYVIDLGGLLAGNARRFFGFLGSGQSSLAKFRFKVFPYNVEVTVQMPGSGGQFIQLHYSLADINKLSTPGYKPRVADDRVGYFLTALKDFSVQEEGRFVRYINRWHLVKRDPKLKLCAPKKPIVFYIEKTVPVRYRRYVREGIELWNKAFRKCGFLNAIEVRQQEADNEFANLDPEDMRYNFFRWITSETPFAMGPSRANPKTGEIIDADIIMDDSMVVAYLRQYEQMVRELNEARLTDLERAYLEARPQRHPDRVLRRFAQAQLERCKTERRASTAYRDPLEVLRLRHPNRYQGCTIGVGMAHELSLAYLWFLADEDKDKNQEKSKKKPKKKEFPEEFIGQVIREIVAHEVGHTLGLRHNFKASTYRSLKEINSGDKPADISGSVMDYNPVNIAVTGKQGYWAPADLGPYDYWAIEYGYKPVKSPKELKAIADRAAEPGLAYGTDEDVYQGDPTINRWDLGDDPIAYARERVGLVQKLMKKIVDRAVAEGEPYYKLRRAFDALLFVLRQAGEFAVQHVGGHYVNRDHRGQPKEREPIQVVPAAKQREGLKFCCDYIFSDRLFRFSPKLLRHLAQQRWYHWGTRPGSDLLYPLHERILNLQTWVLFDLFSPETLRRVYDAEKMVEPGTDCMTLVELFDTLEKSIWSELDRTPPKKGTPQEPVISSIRRNLQRYYVEQLIDISLDTSNPWLPSAVGMLARAQVRQLKGRIEAYLNRTRNLLDPYTAAHLEEARTLLEKAIEAAFQLRTGTSGSQTIFFF